MGLPDKKYIKRIYPVKIKSIGVYVDVYRVLDAFPTNSAAIDHAIKKLLCGGDRGAKSKLQDYQEAIRSIEQAIEIIKSKEKQ